MLSASIKVTTNHVHAKIRMVKAATAAATWRGAQAVLGEARRRVRVGETHEVLDSLQIIGAEGDERLKVGSPSSHGGRPVARFLEDGTAHSHARPFLRPSAAVGRKVLKQDAEALIRAAADG